MLINKDNLRPFSINLVLLCLFSFFTFGAYAQNCSWKLDLTKSNYRINPIKTGNNKVSAEYWQVTGLDGPSEYTLQPYTNFQGCSDRTDVNFAFVLHRKGKLLPEDLIYIEYKSDLTKKWKTALEMNGSELASLTKPSIISGHISGEDYKNVNSLDIRLGMRADDQHTSFKIYKEQICVSDGEADFCQNYLFKLPLDLVSFDTKTAKSNAVEVCWKTIDETKITNFEVERSLDSKKWMTIAMLDAKNVPSEQYKFVDNILDAGNYYYRLKMVLEDGNYSYSNEITAKVKGKSQAFVLPSEKRRFTQKSVR